MAEFMDPRRFLPAEKLNSIKSRNGMDDVDVSAAFQEFDLQLKDSAPLTEKDFGKRRENDRLWQLMGVLGDDAPRYMVSLRHQRVRRDCIELQELEAIRSDPVLGDFIKYIGSTRVSPGRVDAYGQYADDLAAGSAGAPGKRMSDGLSIRLTQAVGQGISLNLYPEAPPAETSESMYHKLQLLSALKEWAQRA